MAAGKSEVIKVKPTLIMILGSVMWMTGCTTDFYHWGRYEYALYNAYAHPEEWDRIRLIDLMEEDREKARTTDRPLPPGWHGHMGLLYYDDGQLDRALAEFQAEQQQFPESAPFMNHLLNRMSQQHPGQPGQDHSGAEVPGEQLAGSDAGVNP